MVRQIESLDWSIFNDLNRPVASPIQTEINIPRRISIIGKILDYESRVVGSIPACVAKKAIS